MTSAAASFRSIFASSTVRTHDSAAMRTALPRLNLAISSIVGTGSSMSSMSKPRTCAKKMPAVSGSHAPFASRRMRARGNASRTARTRSTLAASPTLTLIVSQPESTAMRAACSGVTRGSSCSPQCARGRLRGTVRSPLRSRRASPRRARRPTSSGAANIRPTLRGPRSRRLLAGRRRRPPRASACGTGPPSAQP